MDMSINTKDFVKMSQNPGAITLILVIIMGGMLYMLGNTIVGKTDAILNQGSKVERELAEGRAEFSAGLEALGKAISDLDTHAATRANRAEAIQDRLARLSAAQCQVLANGDSRERQRCTNADLGIEEEN